MAKKLAENILVVSFKKESETYQAFTELKEAFVDDDYFVSQAVIVKKEDGEVVVKDQVERPEKGVDDTLKGGLVGGLVGLLGGPLGVLLGGSVGAAIGELKDTGDAVKDFTLLDEVSECVPEGKTALIILADEVGDVALTEKLNAYDTKIIRMSTAKVMAEIERADKADAKAAEKEWNAEIKELKKYYDKKVDENLLIVNYKTQSDAYQAFSELKQDFVDDYYFISQGVLIKKEDGEYVIKDEIDRPEKAVNDTLKGGLIGSLVGLLAGPWGSLIGGEGGAVLGELKDTGDVLSQFSMLDYVYEHIKEGETVVALLADEKGNDALNKKLTAFDVTIKRMPVDKVAKEMEKAYELELKRKEKEREEYYKQQAEETEQELSDMYNRAGSSFKL